MAKLHVRHSDLWVQNWLIQVTYYKSSLGMVVSETSALAAGLLSIPCLCLKSFLVGICPGSECATLLQGNSLSFQLGLFGPGKVLCVPFACRVGRNRHFLARGLKSKLCPMMRKTSNYNDLQSCRH
jgi:hypothetical protein